MCDQREYTTICHKYIANKTYTSTNELVIGANLSELHTNADLEGGVCMFTVYIYLKNIDSHFNRPFNMPMQRVCPSSLTWA